MWKKLSILILILLFMLASLAGYIILTEKIAAGTIKIAEGQQQLEAGERKLARGKARLASGERQLSQAKRFGKGLDALPFVGLVTLPVSAGVMVAADKQISAGGRQVVAGRAKIRAGEQQLADGRIALAQGIEKLHLANQVRIVFAVAAILFAILFVGLSIHWRQTLAQLLRKKK